MRDLLIKAYALFTVAAPAAAVCRLARRRLPPAARHADHIYPLLAALFTLYLAAVFQVTGAGTLADLLRYGFELRPSQLNLNFFTSAPTSLGYRLNILLFFPFGFLLPALWPGLRRCWATGLAGLGFSLLIEGSQLLNIRVTDVDDLTANFAGALLGYAAWRLAARFCPWLRSQGRRAAGEPLLYIAAMFLGRFLLFDEFRLAKLLYGF